MRLLVELVNLGMLLLNLVVDLLLLLQHLVLLGLEVIDLIQQPSCLSPSSILQFFIQCLYFL